MHDCAFDFDQYDDVMIDAYIVFLNTFVGPPNPNELPF